MERRRLLVTGSRTWDDAGAVWRALKAVWDVDPDVLLVHGAATKGADLLCDTYWDEYLGGGVERVPADWYPGGQLDRAAGYKRNAEMVRRGAWGCLAFVMPCAIRACAGKVADRGLPYHGTHGSVHCAGLAEDGGITVRRFTAPEAGKPRR